MSIQRTPMTRAGYDRLRDEVERLKKERPSIVRAIAEARGPAALTRLWVGPETLPRDGEIEAPERWITRVMDGVAATS